MRRSWFVIAILALFACGLDVVGIAPEPAGPATDASPGDVVVTEAIAPGEDVYIPPFDAGAAEVVLENITALSTIAVSTSKLIVGGEGEALVLDLGTGVKSTLAAVINARALQTFGNEVYFVTRKDERGGQVGHVTIGGTDQVHDNEPVGVDVFYASNLLAGAYSSKVVSYTLPKIDPITPDRSDDQGTPAGITHNGNTVYWSDPARGTIWQADVMGTANRKALTTGLDRPASLLLIPNVVLYVTTATEILGIREVAGVIFKDEVVKALEKPTSLVADARHLYWIDATSGLLKRADRAKFEVQIFGTLRPFTDTLPRLIGFDGTNVYWGSPNEGKVYRRKVL